MRHLALLFAIGCGHAATPVADQPTPAAPPPVDPITEPHRGLTPGERALLRPLFHDSLAYDRIHVIDGKFTFQPDHVYMTPRGNIYAPGDLYEADFSARRVDPYRQAIFVHEITHVWQFENGMDLIAEGFATFAKASGAYERAYPYTLERDRDLVDYGMEQQASIVEDYFVMTVHHGEPQRIENLGLDAFARGELYTAVLANFLSNARYARAMSPREIAEHHAARAAHTTPSTKTCDADDPAAKAKHLCAWRFAPQ